MDGMHDLGGKQGFGKINYPAKLLRHSDFDRLTVSRLQRG